MKYYAINSLPDPWDIVWCRYPVRENPGKAGLVSRPTLVWQTRILEDEDGIHYGAVTVSYGGDAKGEKHTPQSKDIIIDDWAAVKAIGLHKPTRFSTKPFDRPEFVWGPEFFIPQAYFKIGGIKIGRLDQTMIQRLKDCLKVRGA